MQQDVDKVISKHLGPAGKPIQGKGQISQGTPVGRSARMLHGANQRLCVEFRDLNFRVVNDVRIVVEVPRGMKSVAVSQKNQKKENDKGAI